MAPRRPKMAQRRPKMVRKVPRWPQDGRRWSQDGPKIARFDTFGKGLGPKTNKKHDFFAIAVFNIKNKQILFHFLGFFGILLYFKF